MRDFNFCEFDIKRKCIVYLMWDLLELEDTKQKQVSAHFKSGFIKSFHYFHYLCLVLISAPV